MEKIYDNLEICIKMNNLYLSKIGLDYQEILNNEGLIKSTKGNKKKDNKEKWIPWYQEIGFTEDEDYQAWKTECLSIIEERYKSSDEETVEMFRYFDLIHGIPQNYYVESL